MSEAHAALDRHSMEGLNRNSSLFLELVPTSCQRCLSLLVWWMDEEGGAIMEKVVKSLCGARQMLDEKPEAGIVTPSSLLTSDEVGMSRSSFAIVFIEKPEAGNHRVGMSRSSFAILVLATRNSWDSLVTK